MKVLITRFGGMGDVFPIGVAAEQLHKQGHTVDLALRSDGVMHQIDFFENCPYINNRMEYTQEGPWGNRMVTYEHGKQSIEAIYDKYDLVVDYMNSIEGNNTCNSTKVLKATDSWQLTRCSNWSNWYDMALAWVNIDPTKVQDSGKRPNLILSAKEKKIVKKAKEQYKQIIGIHPFASSLARTWYQVQECVPLLQKEYPDALIVAWDAKNNCWHFLSPTGQGVDIDIKSPIRLSMVVTAMCDVYVTVDTGFGHVAEGLGVKHICIYSTVPSWTRAKYYQHQTAIDMGTEHPEYYTFALRTGDPLNIEEGIANLTQRESKMKGMMEKRTPPEAMMKEFNTDNQGLKMEIDCLNNKLQSFERIQSKAISQVTPEMVFEKVKELMQ